MTSAAAAVPVPMPVPMPLPVMLLHGQPGGGDDWDPLRPLLDGLRVLAPDRPGYDGSLAGGFWHNADAVVRYLDAAGIERAVVVGYSWSGGVALATALRAPDRVAGLALVASVGTRAAYGRVDQLIATRAGGAVFATVMRGLGPRLAEVSARNVGSKLGPAELEHVRAILQRSSRGPHWYAWRVEQAAMVRETSALERRLGEIMVPAVVLAGRADRSVPVQAGRELAHRLGNAVLHEVDGGHLLLLEHPAAVATAIREAVRRAADESGRRSP